MTEFVLGSYRLEVDVEATRAWYGRYGNATGGCGCAYCRNYAAAVGVLPPEAAAFLEPLGLNLRRPGDIGEYGPRQGGRWYMPMWHIAGRLLEAGLTPVFPAIMHDGRGTLLNCNADGVATALATALARRMPTDLVFCFEKRGVLRNPDDEGSVIPEITADDFAALRAEGVVSKGMLPKIEQALKAVEAGVRSVVIRSADHLDEPSGTVIRRRAAEQ